MKQTTLNFALDSAACSLSSHASPAYTAKRILAELMKFRRVSPGGNCCKGMDCPSCTAWHLPKIISSVQRLEPVTLLLPSFPGKSPNATKVLGALPDYAEQLSLQFLGSLSQSVRRYYHPGLKIILCSDGRVFSDVVGMKESNVSAYQAELSRLIADLSLTDIATFNLDDHYKTVGFTQMRDDLMGRYGNSMEVLQNKIRNGASESANVEEQEANRMYRGITRFLFEDSLYPEQTKSRTVLQREARSKAYEVVRRSNAWSELIAERFPHGVRLSIHPQTCGARKLGIRLVANENWMTPWHGVALETETAHILMKRSEAEALGAEVVYSKKNGRPSHYRLTIERRIPQEDAVYEI